MFVIKFTEQEKHMKAFQIWDSSTWAGWLRLSLAEAEPEKTPINVGVHKRGRQSALTKSATFAWEGFMNLVHVLK